MKLYKRVVILTSVMFGLVALSPQTALAGFFRDRVDRSANKPPAERTSGDAGQMISSSSDPIVIKDISYGRDKKQKFDVYAPRDAEGAPVIFMVHGGAWFLGDKAQKAVIANKVARWLPRGFIFISTNYRLVPDAGPVEQAKDIARALAVAQEKASSWGGDRRKFILMGHSSGAHLVALLSASRKISQEFDVSPWLGSVILDSASLNVPSIMEAKHRGFYDRAFGGDSRYWRSASPYHMLEKDLSPMLVVCSASRRDNSCGRADQFAAKAKSLGARTRVVKVDLQHRQINERLGEDREYTNEVENFLRSLDPAVEKAL